MISYAWSRPAPVFEPSMTPHTIRSATVHETMCAFFSALPAANFCAESPQADNCIHNPNSEGCASTPNHDHPAHTDLSPGTPSRRAIRVYGSTPRTLRIGGENWGALLELILERERRARGLRRATSCTSRQRVRRGPLADGTKRAQAG